MSKHHLEDITSNDAWIPYVHPSRARRGMHRKHDAIEIYHEILNRDIAAMIRQAESQCVWNMIGRP